MLERRFYALLSNQDRRSMIMASLPQETLLQLCLTSTWLYDCVAPIAYQYLSIETEDHYNTLIQHLEGLIRLAHETVPEDDSTLLQFYRSTAALNKTKRVHFLLDPSRTEATYGRTYASASEVGSNSGSVLMNSPSESGPLPVDFDVAHGPDGDDAISVTSDQEQAWASRESFRLSAEPDESGVVRVDSPADGRQGASESTALVEEEAALERSLSPDAQLAAMPWEDRFAQWQNEIDIRPPRPDPEFLRSTSPDDMARADLSVGDLSSDTSSHSSSRGSWPTVASWPGENAQSNQDDESIALSVPASRDQDAEDEVAPAVMLNLGEKFQIVIRRLLQLRYIGQQQEESAHSVVPIRHAKQDQVDAIMHDNHTCIDAKGSPEMSEKLRWHDSKTSRSVYVPFSGLIELTIGPSHYIGTSLKDFAHAEDYNGAFPNVTHLTLGIDPQDENDYVWAANVFEIAKLTPRVEDLKLAFLRWSTVDRYNYSHLSGLLNTNLHFFHCLRTVHISVTWHEYKGQRREDGRYDYELNYGQPWGAVGLDLLVRVLLEELVMCRDGCIKLTDDCLLDRAFRTMMLCLPPREDIQWYDHLQGYLTLLLNDLEASYGRRVLKLGVKIPQKADTLATSRVLS